MKNIFLLLILVTCSVFSQNNPAKLENGVETKFISVDTLTTTERDALTVVANKGTIIFNATTEQYEGYNPITSSWGALGGGFDESANYSPSGFWNFTGNMQSTGNVDFLGTFEWHNNSFRATMPNLTQNDTIAVKSDFDDYPKKNLDETIYGAWSFDDAVLFQGGVIFGSNNLFRNGVFSTNLQSAALTGNYTLYLPSLTANDTIALKSDITSGSSFDEFLTSTGTRDGVDLITTIGDYDDSGNGNKIIINDGEDSISLGGAFGNVSVLGGLESTSNFYNYGFFQQRSLGDSLYVTIEKPLLTANRSLELPDSNGTIATEEYVAANSSITAGKIGDTPVAVMQLQFQGEDVTFSEENGVGTVSVNTPSNLITPKFPTAQDTLLTTDLDQLIWHRNVVADTLVSVITEELNDSLSIGSIFQFARIDSTKVHKVVFVGDSLNTYSDHVISSDRRIDERLFSLQKIGEFEYRALGEFKLYDYIAPASNLILNSTFDDSSNVTISTDWSITGGVAVYTHGDGSKTVDWDLSENMVAGNSYNFTLDILNLVSGDARFQILVNQGGSWVQIFSNTNYNSGVDVNITAPAGADSTQIRILTSSVASSFDIDNASLTLN
jgi:hypothetical protein